MLDEIWFGVNTMCVRYADRVSLYGWKWLSLNELLLMLF